MFFVFCDKVPAELSPARAVDHDTKTIEHAKPPHRALFQLSSSELVATKKCTTGLLNKNKIRLSRSSYEVSLFSVIQKRRLRGFIN